MALTPDTVPPADDPKNPQRSREQDVLLREVDEAYRQDQVAGFMARYGRPLIAALVLGLAGFGGWLWWSEHREGQREATTETLVQVSDRLDAGRADAALEVLTPVAAGDAEGAALVAKLTRAGILAEQGKSADAAKIYAAIARDSANPKPLRDLATIREVAVNYAKMKPSEVEARLKPLATPGSPFFGSAGEMLGTAYLDQGKTDLAGPLFAEIAKDETVPPSLRSRARQLAGLLGVDAVVDVDATLKEVTTAPEGTAQ